MVPVLMKLLWAPVLPLVLIICCLFHPNFCRLSAFWYGGFQGFLTHMPLLVFDCRRSLVWLHSGYSPFLLPAFRVSLLFSWGFCFGWRLRSSAARLGVPPLHWGTSTNQALFKKWEVHRLLRLRLEGFNVPLVTLAWI